MPHRLKGRVRRVDTTRTGRKRREATSMDDFAEAMAPYAAELRALVDRWMSDQAADEAWQRGSFGALACAAAHVSNLATLLPLADKMRITIGASARVPLADVKGGSQ